MHLIVCPFSYLYNMEINTNQELHHYSYPKIGQFRNVIKTVQLQAAFKGLDEQGEPIYDGSVPKPKLTFTGTVKLHGTNAAIVLDRVNDLIYFQSRENVITPLKDNAGCATYLSSIQGELEMMFSDIPGNLVIIYGEWAGGNIQKGVALNQIEKSFFIFDIRVDGHYGSPESISKYSWDEKKIYNIHSFPTWELEIDFNYPELSQNKLIDLTMEVEKECPVGKAFGVNGIGEGIVWSCGEHKFKVKGEEHSVSKVKVLAAVDIEKVQGIKDFVEQTVTDNRCRQGLEKLTEAGKPLDNTSIGDFIKWVREDILKEELDTIVGNGLEVKDINGVLSKKAKDWFMQNV